MLAGVVHTALIVLLQISYVLSAQSNTAEATYACSDLLDAFLLTDVTIHSFPLSWTAYSKGLLVLVPAKRESF